MIGFSRNKDVDKAPHRGAGAVFAASSVLTLINANAALESVGNTTMDTIRYAGSALVLGTVAAVSFLKFGRNFEATMPPQETPAANIPNVPHSSRGAGPLFVASSITAAANVTAIETFSNINMDTIRNGGSALVLAGVAAVSLVNRLRNVEAPTPISRPSLQPAVEYQADGPEPEYEFAKVVESSLAVEEKLRPHGSGVMGGAAARPLSELLENVARAAEAAQNASLQAAFRGTSNPIF